MHRSILERLTALLLPDLGDGALLVVLDDEGHIAERTVAHADTSKRDALLALGGLLADRAGPLQRALVRGEPVIVGDLATKVPIAGVPAAADSAGVRSAICVPLGHEVVGNFALFGRTPHQYARTHLPLLAEVGRCAERILRPSNDPRSEAESLLAGVHHDLANPLMAVRLNLEVVSALVGEGSAPHPHVVSARRAVDQMAALLEELSEYLRPKVSAPTEPERCVAGAAVSDVLEALSPLAHEKNIRLVANLDDAGAAVAIDRHPLSRVLSNLVVNAIKYTQPGGHVHLSTTRAADGIVFRVQDDGPGMSNDARTHVLEPAWVAKSELRGGSGLGLAIVRRIVQARGGTLQVTSALGVGSTFVVSLPLAAAVPPASP